MFFRRSRVNRLIWSCSQATLVGTQEPAAIFAVMVCLAVLDAAACAVLCVLAQYGQDLVFGPDQTGLLAAGATSPSNLHHAACCSNLRG